MIRLACRYCERNDCDMIESIPPGWSHISEVRPLGRTRYMTVDWFTHLGICPNCWKDDYDFIVEDMAELAKLKKLELL